MTTNFLNDQQQLEALQSWWKKYGRYLIGLILLIAVMLVGWRYWQGHDRDVSAEASSQYESMLGAIYQHDWPGADHAALTLEKSYSSSPYAVFAALFLADHAVQEKNYSSAKAQLQWALKYSPSTALSALATLRLARIQIAEHQPERAIELLRNPPDHYRGPYALIRGDALAEMKSNHAASMAYQAALNELPKTSALADMAKMKMSSLPATH